MEIVTYLLIGIIGLFLILRFLPTRGVRQITTTQLKNELNDKSKQFIDVRTASEFNSRKIKGFRNIPLQILPQTLNELSKEKEVVIICQSGMRSTQASRILKKAGYKQITNVKGGMNAWH